MAVVISRQAVPTHKRYTCPFTCCTIALSNRHFKIVIFSSPAGNLTHDPITMRWTSALPLEVGQLFTVSRLSPARHSSATSTMTDLGMAEEPWKADTLPGPSLQFFCPTSNAPSRSLESEFFASARALGPSRHREGLRHRDAPSSRPMSRYPLGMPTPSPSPKPGG
jgi:hypothetical protein